MKPETKKSAKNLAHVITIALILTLSAQSVFGQTSSDSLPSALVLTTAFDLPIVRFNLLEETGSNNQEGNVEFFNSVGAGLGIKFGKIKTYTNNNEEFIEFSNIVGLSAGVLFSSSKTENGRENIFAPTLGISLLDFKMAVGYELGDRIDGVKPVFFTIAYGIPLSKLTQKSGYILKNYSKSGPQKGTFF